MTQKLQVIALPDAACAAPAILHACLYFDEVYLEAFAPSELQLLPDEKPFGSLQLKLKPARLDPSLNPLLDAEVVRRLSTGNKTIAAPSSAALCFSSRELPLELREAIAASLGQGTDILTAALFSLANKHRPPVRLPRRLSFSDPSNLDDPSFELAICTHVASTTAIFALGQSNSFTPFVAHKAHARLLSAMAESFPSIARAFGVESPELLSIRHATLAQTILQEFLPDVRVKAAEDILALREELKTELSRFRAEVGRLSTILRNEPWADGLRVEIETLMMREVRPAVADLRNRLAKPTQRIVKHLVSDWKTLASGSALSLAAVLMPNVQLPCAILGGISAGIGVAALKAKVEEWSTKSDSAFTFVLEVEKKLS